MLFGSPDCHLACPQHPKDTCGNALCHDGNNCPSEDLEEVVGERDEIEAVSVGYGSLFGARRTEVAHVDMRDQVGDFEKGPCAGAGEEEIGVVHDAGLDKGRGRSVFGAVYV